MFVIFLCSKIINKIICFTIELESLVFIAEVNWEPFGNGCEHNGTATKQCFTPTIILLLLLKKLFSFSQCLSLFGRCAWNAQFVLEGESIDDWREIATECLFLDAIYLKKKIAFDVCIIKCVLINQKIHAISRPKCANVWPILLKACYCQWNRLQSNSKDEFISIRSTFFKKNILHIPNDNKPK